MRLGILSRSPTIGSTRRMAEAAKARRAKVQVLDPLKVEMHLDGHAAHLYHRRKPLPRFDAVIPRIAASINNYGLAVVNQFGLTGVVLVNDATAIAQSRNKMRCLQLLSSHGIDIPATVMAQSARDLKDMVPLVGGMPVLVKLLHGRPGVMVCESTTSLEAALEAVLGLGQNILIQQYVKGRKGRDIRVLVVGGQVVAAVRRTPRTGRFYRTLGRGAAFEKVDLPRAYEHAASKAARLVGLEVAAVDMLDDEGGPKVFEVNSSPSLPELEAATGKDLAGLVVEHALELVQRQQAGLAEPPPLPEPPAPLPPRAEKPRRRKRAGGAAPRGS